MALAQRLSGLIVPRNIAEDPPTKRLVCRVPGCKHPGWPVEDHAKYVRHVARCSERNSDEIEAVVAQETGNYFTEVADHEMYAHYRKGGT